MLPTQPLLNFMSVMVKIAAALAGALALVTLLVFALARSDDGKRELQDFLQPTAGCPAPCWLGIRPGVTSSLEAVRILRAQPWVTDIYSLQGIVLDSSFVRWGWNGKQPDFIDGERQALMWLHKGIVYYIEIPLTIPFGYVVRALAEPEQESTTFSPALPMQVFYEAAYGNGTLLVRSIVDCPLNAWNVVAARVDVRIVNPTDVRPAGGMSGAPCG